MAVAARKLENEYAYMPATRVYSKAAALRAQREQEKAENDRIERAQRAARAKAASKEALRKLSILLAVAVAMASILLMLIRYCNINSEYAAVNILKTNIENVKQEITGLNVQLNSAVSLQEAREAAEKAGLGYPKGNQIVTITPQEGRRAQNTQDDADSQVEILN